MYCFFHNEYLVHVSDNLIELFHSLLHSDNIQRERESRDVC